MGTDPRPEPVAVRWHGGGPRQALSCGLLDCKDLDILSMPLQGCGAHLTVLVHCSRVQFALSLTEGVFLFI